MGKAQGLRQFVVVTAAPLGHRTVTPIATQHGDAYQRQNGRQWMPPAPWIAGVRDFVSASNERTDWGFHGSHLLIVGSQGEIIPPHPLMSRELNDPDAGRVS
jgi:hypothetical protein